MMWPPMLETSGFRRVAVSIKHGRAEIRGASRGEA